MLCHCQNSWPRIMASSNKGALPVDIEDSKKGLNHLKVRTLTVINKMTSKLIAFKKHTHAPPQQKLPFFVHAHFLWWKHLPNIGHAPSRGKSRQNSRQAATRPARVHRPVRVGVISFADITWIDARHHQICDWIQRSPVLQSCVLV